MSAVRAVIFDFNGTISDDEAILERLFRELFAELGVEIDAERYYRELAGLSDPAIIDRGLELGGLRATPELRADLLRTKTQRYKHEVARESPIGTEAAAFVRAAAERLPVAIASGAYREEVESVLEAAGLRELFAAIVCIDDVQRGKPDPQGYRVALARLGGALRPEEILVFEDADPGVQAAKAAGMRCAALLTPAYTGSPVAADITLAGLDPAAVDSLLA